jgi:quinolinate synthase
MRNGAGFGRLEKKVPDTFFEARELRFVAQLPETYRQMEPEEIRRRILERKKGLGRRLVILGHHYQRQDVIDFADFRGDSLGLSRLAADQEDCEFIVFCGVRFMAESAEILRREHQRVQHPDPKSGCPLADMADIASVRRAWGLVAGDGDDGKVTPITYMNSGSDLKAFCGRRGGAVCTSSNAGAAFKWARAKGEKIFFFPDENLGRNTARQVGIPREEILLWDPEESPLHPGIEEQVQAATLILWKGFCHVHTDFKPEHIRRIREEDPEARIVVHPECSEEVVAGADAVGSTELICRYVEQAPAGSSVYIGTEINLVARLAQEHPDKRIFEVFRSLCPNMFRIDPAKLLWILDGIGEIHRVHVAPDTKELARVALENMLSFS